MTKDGLENSQRPEILFQMLGDEGVLVDMEGDQMYRLNETGACFYSALTRDPGAISAQRIATAREEVLAKFEVEEGVLDESIQSLLDALGAANLLDRPQG